MEFDATEVEDLKKQVVHLLVEVCVDNKCAVNNSSVEKNVRYFLENQGIEKLVDSIPEEDENGEFSPSINLQLPHANLEGLWENLLFDTGIKQLLLNYATTSLVYTQFKVNNQIITWNRVILLHGPPGTGKTSLCKALAHKLSIRLSTLYKSHVLVEINAHSLFSKWFSESGKLVMKMFGSLRELTEDEDTFVYVLIDEVESLTAARSRAVTGSEPSDALRVVNAVLTELDRLKNTPNVLVMTTSNLTQAIDEAFLDRADIVQYIGLPQEEARYSILLSCIRELQRCSFIDSTQNIEESFNENSSNQLTRFLSGISKIAKGLSGRALPRIAVPDDEDEPANETIRIPETMDFTKDNFKSPHEKINSPVGFSRRRPQNHPQEAKKLLLKYDIILNFY